MAGGKTARSIISWAVSLSALCLGFSASASAGLVFSASYGTSITGNGNAAQIEGAIQTAIGNIEALYTNDVTIPVTFTYTPGAPGNLLSTGQSVYGLDYADYESALISDYILHPANTVLGSAIANLGSGNDANGANSVMLTAAQVEMLGIAIVPGNVTININSSANFSFTDPTPDGQFDLVGGLEHELDETMGGGGAGSTLNAFADGCSGDSAPLCNLYGALDLLRYSAPNTPGFATSSSATAYLSVDGGVTPIIAFNQFSNGDYGDFAPPGGGAGQVIQNAFNSTGQDEAYTTSSPEFIMEEAIGWDNTAAIPEPGTIALACCGLAFIGTLRRRSA